jgi:hypothetical protein
MATKRDPVPPPRPTTRPPTPPATGVPTGWEGFKLAVSRASAVVIPASLVEFGSDDVLMLASKDFDRWDSETVGVASEGLTAALGVKVVLVPADNVTVTIARLKGDDHG